MSDLRLASLFSQHMVLQRGRSNPLWGWDTPGQRVIVRVRGRDLDWVGEATAATVPTGGAEQGAFRVDLPVLGPPGPYTLTISGSSQCCVENVAVGEVWLASGQSNMEWPLAQSGDADQEVRSAALPALRFFKVAHRASSSELSTVEGQWQVCSSLSAGNMSAIGYFFAKLLQQELNVPIGIVMATWGGTRVEAWASRPALERCSNLNQELADIDVDESERERLREAYQRESAQWEAKALPQEPPNRGEKLGWHQPDFDDSSWGTLQVPGIWQSQGMPFNGVVWYRLSLELPAQATGSELRLSLGPIDDFDHTYFNGALVGSHPKGTPLAHQISRCYTVPAHLVKPGSNVVAVRVFDHYGEGGFVGQERELFIESKHRPEQRWPLSGSWRACVEAQIPKVPAEVFNTCPQLPLALVPEHAPGALFNGMIAGLVPFGIAGVVWYQGESNTGTWQSYRERFTALIRDWRTRWGQGQYPFYFVQLANFKGGDDWPRLREAQHATLSEPTTAMATAIDVGEADDIHPRNKRAVGERLARLALADWYQRTPRNACSPEIERVDFQGNLCRVHFTHAEGLHTTDGHPQVQGFALAGDDAQFCVADAWLEGSTVIVNSPQVAQPVALRYAFDDDPRVNLVNGAGLPALPFRSDGW